MFTNIKSLGDNILVKILLGLLVLMFGVWGIGDVLRTSGNNVTVASVGGDSISGVQFARALYQEKEKVQRILGDKYSPEALASLNLGPRVLQTLIDRSLIRQESEALGLVPANADVVQRIRDNPAFQDSKGNFDKALFDAMLQHSNLSEKTYVEDLRGDIAANLLVSTLLAAAPVSDTAVNTLLEAHQEKRSVTLYTLGPSLVNDIPKPDDAELKAYYNDHSRTFTAPEYRTLSYVAITAADAQSAAPSEDELKNAYKERIEEFKHPERRTVEQLLYSSEDAARKAEAALKGGKSFEDVAKTTDILNKGSTSLGKVERSGIIESAAEAVFSLPVGGNTAPIQSPFGWHIFRVTAIEPPSTDNFEQARPILEKDFKQRDAEDALNKLANKLEDALAGGATLQEAAHDFNLKLLSVGPVSRAGLAPDGSKVTLPDYDKFIDTAFKPDEKTESPLTLSKGGAYYIVRVEKVAPERLRPLEEIKDVAAAGWQMEERGKRLGELAKSITAQFGNAAGRSAAAAKYNLKPFSTGTLKREDTIAGSLTLPPELVADVFAHKPQESTKAYPMANGSYVIAVVDGIIPMPTADKDDKLKAAREEIRQNLETSVQNELLDAYTRYLAQKYKVSINDAAMLSVAGSASRASE